MAPATWTGLGRAALLAGTWEAKAGASVGPRRPCTGAMGCLPCRAGGTGVGRPRAGLPRVGGSSCLRVGHRQGTTGGGPCTSSSRWRGNLLSISASPWGDPGLMEVGEGGHRLALSPRTSATQWGEATLTPHCRGREAAAGGRTREGAEGITSDEWMQQRGCNSVVRTKFCWTAEASPVIGDVCVPLTGRQTMACYVTLVIS